MLVHNACNGACEYGIYCGGYWCNVREFLKGMAWTGPKKLVTGAAKGACYTVEKTASGTIRFVSDTIQTTSDAIDNTITSVENLGTSVKNGTLAVLNDPFIIANAASDFGNDLSDNPEKAGALYFNAGATVASVYTGGVFIDQVNYARNRSLLQNIANRADRKFQGIGPVVGAQKHKYAETLLEKYQKLNGHKNLHPEVRYVNQKV